MGGKEKRREFFFFREGGIIQLGTDGRGGKTEKRKTAAGELEVGLLPRLIHVLLVSSSFWVYLALFISLDWIICYISSIFWIIFFLLIVDIADYHSTLAMATFVTHPTSPLPIP